MREPHTRQVASDVPGRCGSNGEAEMHLPTRVERGPEGTHRERGPLFDASDPGRSCSPFAFGTWLFRDHDGTGFPLLAA